MDGRSVTRFTMMIDSMNRAQSAALACQRMMHNQATGYQQRANQAMECATQFAQEASVMQAAKDSLSEVVREAGHGATPR